MSSSVTYDMTKGKIGSQLLLFSLPIFLSQTFQQLYNTADTFVVGHFLGTNSLAAVASSGTLIFLLTSFFEGVAVGAGVVISRYFGSDNPERVDKAIHTTLACGFVAGIFLTLFGVAFTPTLLRWMNTDPEILPQAIEYFRYYFLGSLSLILYNVSRGIMTALGDSRRPLYYLITSSVLNVILDVVFIAVFHWGVWSTAVATVIAQTVSVVLCFLYLFHRQKEIDIRFTKISFDKQSLKEILHYGIPSGVQNSVIGFANVIVLSQINSFGKIATAAFGTYGKIEGFVFLPITSVTMAITTFISQNLGAKEYRRAKRGAAIGIVSAMICAAVVGIVFYAFAPQVFYLFDKSPEVIALGVKQSHIENLFYCMLALSHSIAAVCRGAGKVFVPMGVMLSVWCVFRVTYIFFVMNAFHVIDYVYWAYPITWTISSIIFVIYFFASDWVYGFENQSEKEKNA